MPAPRVLRLAPALATDSLAPQAQAQDSLVGKKVLPKAADAKLWDGDQVAGDFRQSPGYVRKIEGEWLLVRSGGAEGYIRRADVVTLDEAVSYFDAEIRRNPQSTWAYNRRGIALEEKGEYDIAIKDYTEAIRLDPQAAGCWNNRGLARNGQKDYDKAIADYNEAIRLDPSYTLAFINRGIAWENKKEYDKAIADYDEAIRLDPSQALAFNSRGNAWIDKQEYDKAIADFTEAIRLDASHALAFINRGIARENLKDYAKAIADYNEAIRLDPMNAVAFNNRAWLWATCPDARYRDGKKAVESAKRACELDPADWNKRDTLAASHAESGNFNEAVNVQMKALEMAPESEKAGCRKQLELYRKRTTCRTEGN